MEVTEQTPAQKIQNEIDSCLWKIGMGHQIMKDTPLEIDSLHIKVNNLRIDLGKAKKEAMKESVISGAQ